MSRASKVVIIGLDGATYRVLKPLAEAGVMPHVRRFLREGACGTLRSTRPPVTCPAWPSMYTGVGPGKHGVFSFSHRDHKTGRVRTAAVTDVKAPRLWDLAGEAGLRSAVLNVPITFPAQPIEGVMLTGFVSPDESDQVSYPKSVATELREQFGHLALNWLVLGYRPADRDKRNAHIRRINEFMKLRATQFEHILEGDSWDFCFLVHEYPDRVFHLYHHILDPAFAAHADPSNRTTLALLQAGFCELDGFIGRLVRRFGRGANYMIVSDHGFDGVTQWIYLNNLLEANGLVKLHPARVWLELVSRRLNLSVRTRQRLGVEPAELWHRQDPATAPLIDYRRSLAFAGPQLEQAVYVNVKGRFSGGVVEPGEYEVVRARIMDVLSAARDPKTGEPLFEGVWSRDELFSGPYREQAPDIIYELARGYMVSNSILPPSILRDGCLRPLRSGWDVSGYHRPEGVFMGLGPAFAVTNGFDASILDVAPTVLYLLNLEIPDYMDGQVIRPALKSGQLSGQAVRTTHVDPVAVARHQEPYSEAQQLEVSRRLEELGYL